MSTSVSDHLPNAVASPIDNGFWLDRKCPPFIPNRLWQIRIPCPAGESVEQIKTDPWQSGLLWVIYKGSQGMWRHRFVAGEDDAALALRLPGGKIVDFAFRPSPDAKIRQVAITEESKGETWLWDLLNNRAIRRLPTPKQIISMAFSSDGSRLAYGMDDAMGIFKLNDQPTTTDGLPWVELDHQLAEFYIGNTPRGSRVEDWSFAFVPHSDTLFGIKSEIRYGVNARGEPTSQKHRVRFQLDETGTHVCHYCPLRQFEDWAIAVACHSNASISAFAAFAGMSPYVHIHSPGLSAATLFRISHEDDVCVRGVKLLSPQLAAFWNRDRFWVATMTCPVDTKHPELAQTQYLGFLDAASKNLTVHHVGANQGMLYVIVSQKDR